MKDYYKENTYHSLFIHIEDAVNWEIDGLFISFYRRGNEAQKRDVIFPRSEAESKLKPRIPDRIFNILSMACPYLLQMKINCKMRSD